MVRVEEPAGTEGASQNSHDPTMHRREPLPVAQPSRSLYQTTLGPCAAEGDTHDAAAASPGSQKPIHSPTCVSMRNQAPATIPSEALCKLHSRSAQSAWIACMGGERAGYSLDIPLPEILTIQLLGRPVCLFNGCKFDQGLAVALPWGRGADSGARNRSGATPGRQAAQCPAKRLENGSLPRLHTSINHSTPPETRDSSPESAQERDKNSHGIGQQPHPRSSPRPDRPLKSCPVAKPVYQSFNTKRPWDAIGDEAA